MRFESSFIILGQFYQELCACQGQAAFSPTVVAITIGVCHRDSIIDDYTMGLDPDMDPKINYQTGLYKLFFLILDTHGHEE